MLRPLLGAVFSVRPKLLEGVHLGVLRRERTTSALVYTHTYECMYTCIDEKQVCSKELAHVIMQDNTPQDPRRANGVEPVQAWRPGGQEGGRHRSSLSLKAGADGTPQFDSCGTGGTPSRLKGIKGSLFQSALPLTG